MNSRGAEIKSAPEKASSQQEVPTSSNPRGEGADMANQTLMDKYSHITNIEELNQILKETRDFEERRALRAVIRKLRDASNTTPSSRSQKRSAANNTQEESGSKLDLSGYTSEEDLKVLLHQTSDYEDKRRIRAAIRELRKKTDSDKPAVSELSSLQRKAVNNKSEKLSSLTSPSDAELSPTKTHVNDVFSPPPTPDAMTILKSSEVGTPLSKIEVKDEELVSPVKHESRTLQRSEGEIQIEKFSKHSRTTSHSDVYEKSVKITTTSKVGDLSISEQDEIVTKEKLTQKGSVTTESDLIRKVNIKDKDGSQHIEEDISIEKTSHSKTRGEEKETRVQVSIVREKQLPKIIGELVDACGADGDRLTLTCEFEKSAEVIEVSWWKDGQPVQTGKDVIATWDNFIATLNIQVLLYPDDTGSYVCRGKNIHGSVESSAHITVTEAEVKQKLTFSEELTNKSVKDGDADVTLTCKLSEAAAGAEVNWYKNGKVLRDNSEFKQTFDGTAAALIITEVFPEDSGEYECVITHASLELSTLATLHIADTASSPDDKSSAQEDSNNNTCSSEDTKGVPRETTPEEKKPFSNGEELTNGINETIKLTNEEEATDKSTNKESSKSKCEKILQSAAITDDTTNELGKPAEDKPASSNGEKISPPPAEKIGSKTSGFTKPALKSVSKPAAMSRPATAAEDTADSLVGRLSKPGTSGNVSVNQSWKSNVGGSLKSSQTSANKSWGKAGHAPNLLGKPTGSGKSAMAAFKQMDTANNPNAASAPKPNSEVSLNTIPVAKQAAKMIKRRAIGMVEIKHEMLAFCQANTSEYENVKIDNFSTSWNNGVAFLALIHHFYPDSFDWAKVDERRRRENFQLAFDLAEKKADIAPLLDVEDMVRMKKPDWKCVFTYIQSFYRKLRDHENNKHTYMQQ